MAARKRTDPIPSWGNDTIYCDTTCSAEDTFYVGCDDDDYEDHSIRRRKLALAGQRFLDGSVPFIFTSTLKGPFDKSSGWENPWARQRSNRAVSPINKLNDPIQSVPAKKYIRNSNGKRTAKQHQDNAECYLPSPESLKQESIAEAGHPFLDDDELDAVCSWRDSVVRSPECVDDYLSNKRNTESRHWLKTSVRKRKYDEHVSRRTESLNASYRHQFSDNIAANKPCTAPQLKSFSSAPAQLNAPEKFYRSPTSSSTKAPRYSSYIKEHTARRKAHRPSSESEDELSQDQQAATLSSPVSLKLHRTTLITQHSSPLKNQVKLNAARKKRQSPPPVLVINAGQSMHSKSDEGDQGDGKELDEDQDNEERQMTLHGNDTRPMTDTQAFGPAAKDDVSMGDPSDIAQIEESVDNIETNAQQVNTPFKQLRPSILQYPNAEASVEVEVVQEAEISTSLISDIAKPNDNAEGATRISGDEQAPLSDATSDELSEIASDDIPSSVCREIAAQLRSDGTVYDEDDSHSGDASTDPTNGKSSQPLVAETSQTHPRIVDEHTGPLPTTVSASSDVTVEDGPAITSTTQLQANDATENGCPTDSDAGAYNVSPVSEPEQLLGEPQEQSVLETMGETVAKELVDFSPEQDSEPGPPVVTAPEVELVDVDDRVSTPANATSQERESSEFSLRNVLQRLVPSSPWARLSQVAALALAIPQDIAAPDDFNVDMMEQDDSETDAKKTLPVVDDAFIKQLEELPQDAATVSSATVSSTDHLFDTGSNNDDAEPCVESEVAACTDISSDVDSPTDTEICYTTATDIVHDSITAVDDMPDDDNQSKVEVLPENDITIMQSVEDAASLPTNPARCTSPAKVMPTSQAVPEIAATFSSAETPLPLDGGKGNLELPLIDGPFARGTPEPKFNFTSFASFASPIQIHATKKQVSKSTRGNKRSILRRQSNGLWQKKTVTWSTILERTKDSEVETGRGMRERSPPPAAALSELPTANDDKFSKHFSAVVRRTDGLRHKFRSYSNGEKVASDSEPENSQRYTEMSNSPQVLDNTSGVPQKMEKREVSEEPMDVVEDLFAEMGDFLQAFDVDIELAKARKEGTVL